MMPRRRSGRRCRQGQGRIWGRRGRQLGLGRKVVKSATAATIVSADSEKQREVDYLLQLDGDWALQCVLYAPVHRQTRTYRRAPRGCHGTRLTSSRRGGHFEYRLIHTHAMDMPSAVPI